LTLGDKGANFQNDPGAKAIFSEPSSVKQEILLLGFFNKRMIRRILAS
jgi:hypothetical protein